MAFVSAFPAYSTGPSPLVWNVGTLRPGGVGATVTVKASATGSSTTA